MYRFGVRKGRLAYDKQHYIIYAPVAQLYSSNGLLSRRSWVRVPPGVLFCPVKA